MTVLDRETDYNRYSLRLGRQDDLRKPHEVIYSLIMLFLALLYLARPHIFAIVVVFWMMLVFGVLFCFVSALIKWKRSVDAAKQAQASALLERALMRQLEENAELELERVLSRRESRRNRRDSGGQLVSSNIRNSNNRQHRSSDVSSSNRKGSDVTSTSNVEQESSQRRPAASDDMETIRIGQVEIVSFDQMNVEPTTEFGLNVSTYRSLPNSERSCSICLADFVATDRVNYLFCTHVFHDTCMEQWIHSNPDRTCPVCRQPVASDI